jgi:hypothetical protein
MAKDTGGQTLKDYGNRKKRYWRIRVYAVTALLLILLAVGATYLYRLYHRNYSSFEVAGSTPNTEENLTGYMEYDGAVVRYGLDGAVAFDKKGELLWNGSYEMQDPIADTCGKYAVVADRGGNSVHIFNEKGEAGSFTTDYKIIKAEVASQGVSAILMGNDEANYVRLNDREGTNLGEKKTYISEDGYPMDIALSDDGEKLAVILMSLNQGKLINQIAFYNFGEVGQSLNDRFAGGFIFDKVEAVMPEVTFLNNDTVCVYKDNGFILYSMPELPEVIKEVTFITEEEDKKLKEEAEKAKEKGEEVVRDPKDVKEVIKGVSEIKIKSILHDKKYTGFVFEGDNNSSLLVLYDLKGKRLLEKKLELDYTNIYLSGDEIILHDDLSCQILRTDGKEKFRYTFTTNISAFYPINHLDRYFLVNGAEVDDIRLME